MCGRAEPFRTSGGAAAKASVKDNKKAQIIGTGDHFFDRRDMQRIISTILIALAISSCHAEQKIEKAHVSKPAPSIPEDQKDPIADHESFCRGEKGNMQRSLTAAYQRYQREKAPKSIKLLVEVDRKIRSLLKARPTYRPCPDDDDIYDSDWEKMGVHLSHWGHVVYTGDLLYRAHQRAPHSSFRRHTLFSTIMGVTVSHQLGLMPNIKAALQYVEEFPQGPFIEETYWIIAGFYKDLFMVLRDDLNEYYKTDCFKSYIDKTPLPLQAQRAKSKAIASYQTILKLNPTNTSAAELLSEVERGTVKAWSFCAD